MENLQALLDANGVFLTGEDNLRLTTFGGVAGAEIAIEGRLIQDSTKVVAFRERHVPNNNYTAASTVHNLGDGVLTHVQLRATSSALLGGGVFAILEIVRGGSGAVQPLATLLQGYVTTNARLAWPGSPILPSTAGAGRLRTITGTDQVAGVEITETVPAGVRWRLMSFTAILTTSAVVGNRAPSIIIDDGTTTAFQLGTNATVAASGGAGFTWAAGLGSFGGTGNGNAGALPDPTIVGPGYRIRTQTGSFDVGDNWGAPRYLLEEFIE